MNTEQIKSAIESVREDIDRADAQPRQEAQIGITLIAISRLTDVVEALAARVADLAQVQNERATD
jgi:hypothetical protein